MAQQAHLSQDGSHTLYSEKHQAHYHSVFGAVDESLHVFIMAGLDYLKRRKKENIQIFEMGLGTGLNAYLSFLKALAWDIPLNYHAIETTPLSIETASALNYPEILNSERSLFEDIHNCPWHEEVVISKGIHFKKEHQDIESFHFEKNYDLIYWDAFAPNCQAFLWEKEIHQKVYDQLNESGVLVTYCSKGAFRRMLESLGYRTERLSGPRKKREMLRAIKASY